MKTQLILVFRDGGICPRIKISGQTKADVLAWLQANQTEPCERIEWGVQNDQGDVLWMGWILPSEMPVG